MWGPQEIWGDPKALGGTPGGLGGDPGDSGGTHESTWFSKERITGYGDVLKALSAMASITSCQAGKGGSGGHPKNWDPPKGLWQPKRGLWGTPWVLGWS